MSAKIRILIVEDDTPLAMLMVNVLSRAGCELQVANSGAKGMKLAEKNPFDIITLDIDLEDVSGLIICRKLRQKRMTQHTPIIFISGRSSEEDKQRGLWIISPSLLMWMTLFCE
jgi:DNA-binding response OmpR family regulator